MGDATKEAGQYLSLLTGGVDHLAQTPIGIEPLQKGCEAPMICLLLPGLVERHQAVRIAEQYWDTLCAYRQ